jgi:hypothetical protein
LLERSADRVSRAKRKEVLALVKRVALAHGVVEIRDSFSGEVEELGLDVRFGSSASDKELVVARNELVSLLERLLPDGEPFKWVLSVERGSATYDVAFPGDPPLDPRQPLKAIKPD